MHRKVQITLVISAVAFLSACASPQQIAEQARQQQYQAQLAKMEYESRMNSKCANYGFKSGTTEFAQCLQQAEQQESMDNAVKFQQNVQNQQYRQQQFQKAQCYFSGRMDC
jgi:hypothetical protein